MRVCVGDEFSRARQPTPCRHWRIEVSAGGHRYSSCCADEEGSTKRGRSCARVQRDDARGESAQSASDGGGGGSGGEEERGTPDARGARGTRGTDERPPGIIAAGVVRCGGHSITTQWRAYYVVSERV